MKETRWLPGHPTIHQEPQDRARPDVARGITPERLDAILLEADSGDPRDQARLAREMLERDWSIADALQTRALALSGTRWHVEPGEKSQPARDAAERLEAQLRAAALPSGEGAFQDLLDCLEGALVPGYAAAEVVWGAGGRLAAFCPIPQEFIMFRGMEPRLEVRGRAGGVPLDPRRVIFHRVSPRGGDPVRGGLIRPLAWLHVFANINVKDCLSFVERHGMPFITAKVNANAWEKERNALRRLVSNFGPAGGGVFTDNVELQLLESSSTGDVYFRLLDYLDDAVHKVVLGQTASSGEAAGLSKGDAQSRVRQDILEADCARVASCVNAQLVRRWAALNLQPETPAPRFAFDCAAPEDTAALAQTLASLRQAGLQADPEEMGRRFGFALARAPEPQQAQAAFPFQAERPGPAPAQDGADEEDGAGFAARLDALIAAGDPVDSASVEAGALSALVAGHAAAAAAEFARRRG